MAIPIKLQSFEGPLDLLLQLIEKNKVNIYDIPIAEITDQYMAYIAQLSGETLDEMSEFLVMAATLLDIKSRMLLPLDVTEEGEEIDPRQELVDQLLEYKLYRYRSSELRDRKERAAGHFYKEASIPKEVASFREPTDVGELLQNVTLQDLCAIVKGLMKRQEDQSGPAQNSLRTLKKEEVNLAETMQFVGEYIFKKKTCSFSDILRQKPGRQYKIVTFLTLLELMKEGEIEARQPERFSDIRLRWIGGEEFDGPELTELAAAYE